MKVRYAVKRVTKSQRGNRRTESRPQARAKATPVHPMLELQSTLGNQAVQRMLRTGAIQTKPKISQPGDQYEQEADRVAEQIMRMPGPNIMPGASGVPGQPPTIQRLCPECEEEKQRQPIEEEKKKVEQLQMQAQPGQRPTINPNFQARIKGLQSGGQPLAPSQRAFFEPRFSRDFSQVRLHTDARAADIAKSINAKAFTVGRSIAFGAGEYQPGTTKGKKLLAHELTHVVQQGSVKNNSPARLSIQKASEQKLMRSLALDSTVKICHRVLTSRNIKISQGGLRVVLLLNQLDTEIPNCRNHKFWVTLTKSVEWWPDNEIATCEGETGGTRSFSFGNISSGTYYLTIHRVFDHPYCCLEGDILVFDEPISGNSSSCVRDQDLSTMDIVHGALDIAGFIPVLGAIPDGINAAIYSTPIRFAEFLNTILTC